MLLNRKHSIINKLLHLQFRRWQVLGFAISAFLGMAIVLVSVQFAADVIPLFTAKDGFMKPGQIEIMKRVGTVRTISGAAPTFKKKEIEDLRNQKFVKSLAVFTPCRYSVLATIGNPAIGFQFSTETFFESVPDDYIDVSSEDWHYEESSDDVPIILPKNYLDLYNFGFAGSRGMPMISEGLVKMVRIDLLLRGPLDSRRMKGHVVAFSRRLNTILVPQNFMDEMNKDLSGDTDVAPSRIAVKLNGAAEADVPGYLDDNNYTTGGDDLEASRTVSFLRLVVAVVLVIGLVISALSFVLLLLSLMLVMQKHSDKIDNLLLIGYSVKNVSKPYVQFALVISTVVLAMSVLTAIFSRKFYLQQFGELYPSYEIGSLLPAMATGMILWLVIDAASVISVRRKVMAIWNMH